MKKIIWTIISLTLIAIGFLILAYLIGYLTGFPKGADVYCFLTRMRLINDFFPHINWNPFWSTGQYLSWWSHTFVSFIAVSVSKIFSFSMEKSLTVVAASSLILLCWGIYGFIYNLSRNHLAGIFTVVLFISSPAFWSWWSGGNYARLFALGWFGLFLFFSSVYILNLKRGVFKKLYFIGSVFTLVLALISHLLVGIVAGLIIFIFIFFALDNFENKIREALKIFLPTFFLSFYWLIPVNLLTKATSKFFGQDATLPIGWQNFLRPVFGEENFSLSHFLFPLFIFSVILFVIILFSNRIKNIKKISFFLITLAIISFGWFVYNTLDHFSWAPEKWAITGFPPATAFYLFALFFTILIGSLLSSFLATFFKGKMLYLIILLLIILVGSDIFGNFWFYKNTVRDASDIYGPRGIGQRTVTLEKDDLNYRLSSDSAYVGEWFSYLYNHPQTRHFFSQGLIYPDWQNWFETAVFNWSGNYPETEFLLDWFGVREMLVGEPHFNFQKFLERPNDYQFIKKSSELNLALPTKFPYYQFNYQKSSLILSAVNTPTLLVIGGKVSYNIFLQVLAQVNFNSQKIIPLLGQRYIDDYNLKELEKFDAIFLYDYKYHNKKKAFGLLEEYVKNGGGLFIEVHNTKEANEWDLSRIFPIEETKIQEILGDWKLKGQSDLIKDINLSDFAEASYQGKPWQISYADFDDLANWSFPILKREDKVILVGGEFEGGKVVWSGMNLPFHIVANKNQEEAKLFGNIIKYIIKNYELRIMNQELKYEAKFIHPEKREVVLDSPAQGVLFKESYVNNWHAHLEAQSDQLKAKIYIAGPGFMYVPIDKNEEVKKIIFEYHLSWIEKISLAISIITFLFLIIYLFEGWLIKKPIVSSLIKRVISRMERTAEKTKSWWVKEEE